MNILTPVTKPWARTAIIAGFATCLVYPLMITGLLPDWATLVLACAFGPLFMTALYGLYRILISYRDTVAARLGVLFAVGAGTLVTAMLLVQGATNFAWQKAKGASLTDADKAIVSMMGRMTWSVNLGLDVAWDIFGGLATLCVAIAMYRHPWFGRWLSISGVLIAVLLLVLNLATFPTPPANAELFDIGPFVGLWYAVVTVVALVKYRRAIRERTHPTAKSDATLTP